MARVKALEDGLRPFADYAMAMDAAGENWTDDSELGGGGMIVDGFRVSIRYRSLRHARTLLSSTEGQFAENANCSDAHPQNPQKKTLDA